MANNLSNKDDTGQTRSLAKQIMLAFLNATLMLGIILAISGIILIHKVQNFTADTVEIAVQTVGEKRVAKINEKLSAVKTHSDKIIKLSGDVENACRKQADLKPLKALRLEISQLKIDINEMSRNFEDIGKRAARKALEGATKGVENWLGVRETWFPKNFGESPSGLY